MLDWKKLEAAIDEADCVLLTTHTRPDGDALGSELAMADLLLSKGKDVEIVNPSPTPDRYNFLDPQGKRVSWIGAGGPRPQREPDLMIILDTGTFSQLPKLEDFIRSTKAKKIVIDHHVSQDDLGADRFVDVTAPACGILVYRAYKALGIEITQQSAIALFVAIAMDTGWLHHSNSTPEVFRAQADLVERGAQPHEIYRLLYESNSVQRMKLMATLLNRIELSANNQLAISHIEWDDIINVGAHPMDTEDFISHLMAISGVQTALLFIEQRDKGTKVSIRSRTLDCSKLMEQFGGGGHKAAAGASMSVPVLAAKEQVSAVVKQASKPG